LADKESKLASGSIIILLGSIILRLGGFIYRFILTRLLSTTGYGIVGLTIPFQNALIIGASGGVPPAIAKYVSEYLAVDNEVMVHQIIKTAMKLMVFMAVIVALLMFIIAEPIAIGIWNKPEALLPLRLVSVIIPFSVVAGALRGVFQGFYQMKNIFYGKFLEQIFTLICAVILVLLGWYAAGAVLGTALGFLAAVLGSYYLYVRDVKQKYLVNDYPSISFKEELKIYKTILKFSIPVVITGIAEIFLYDTGTFFIGTFLATAYAGFFTNASAISRIPLIISNSVSVSILPAASEAASLKDSNLLKLYLHQAYRYTSIVTLPICAFIMVYALPIMTLLFTDEYAPGAGALTILVAGMFFFAIYTIVSSMCQGLNKPYVPMISLIIGTITNVIFSILLIPRYDIIGAGLSTTISTFVVMSITLIELTRVSKIHPPYIDLVKIIAATVVMTIVMYLIPNTLIGMIIGGIIGSIVYMVMILLLRAIRKEDVTFIKHFINKTGPLKKPILKLGKRFYKYLS